MRVTIEEASKHSLSEIVERVRTAHEPMVLTGNDGDLVRIVPIPKPVRTFKGRPVYKLSDIQYMDFPFWSEDEQSKPPK